MTVWQVRGPLAAGGHSATVRETLLNVAFDLLSLRCVDQWSDLSVGVERVADGQRLRHGREEVDNLVISPAGSKDSRAGEAHLAGVEQRRGKQSVGELAEVEAGVVEDDRRRF